MPRMFLLAKSLVLAFLVSVSGAAPAPDPGETVKVFGDGMAAVTEADYVAARKEALEKALNAALLDALRSVISQDEIEANMQALEEKVFSRGMDFIHSYRFIEDDSEEYPETGEAEYYVRVEYVVFLTYLEKQVANLGIDVAGKKKPVVVLVIDERTLGMIVNPGFLVLPSATEENIKKAIESQGYTVVTRNEIRKLGDNGRVMSAMEGDTKAVEWLAGRYEADYVILGYAMSEAHFSRGAESPYVEGKVYAKVYEGYTLNVVREETAVEKIPGGGGTSSLRAIRLAAEKFKRQIIDFLNSQMVF